MKKLIDETKVFFYDNDNNLIMCIDHSVDECMWYFANSNTITITQDMELFLLLENIMTQQYTIESSGPLKSYKNNNKLVWYSDCYYNPDDEWSMDGISYLTIEYIDNTFKLKCTKPIDNKINRKNKTHVICFSPLGNGQYAVNIKTGLTLQDEFVVNVYNRLLNTEKTKKLNKSMQF